MATFILFIITESGPQPFLAVASMDACQWLRSILALHLPIETACRVVGTPA